jgi:phage baseplate assembly protein W
MSKFITYAIRQGDTLPIIAQTVTGNADDWVKIVILNNLDYPFISTDGTEYTGLNVKKMGENVLIPISEDSSDAIASIIPSYEYENIYNQALGVDIQLYPTNPVSLTDTDQGEIDDDSHGDVALVAGLANLRQALINKFSTPYGTLPRHPEYGTKLEKYLGGKGTSGQLQKIQVEILRTIKTDPRVKDVKIINCAMENRTVNFSITVTPIGFDKAFLMTMKFGRGGIMEWA